MNEATFRMELTGILQYISLLLGHIMLAIKVVSVHPTGLYIRACMSEFLWNYKEKNRTI